MQSLNIKIHSMYKNKIAILIFALTLIGNSTFSQAKVSQCLSKLNKVHAHGRLMFLNKIPEIYINESTGMLDMGYYLVPLNDVEIYYSLESRQLPNKKYHGVKFSCLEGNCIEPVDHAKSSSITSFFKSKKDCYDFMNALNELKKAIR